MTVSVNSSPMRLRLSRSTANIRSLCGDAARTRASEERARISAELSTVQAKLNSYRARLRVESPYVGAHYADLVDTLRHVAGPMIREAWNTDPVKADAQMHGSALDFAKLDASEERFP